MTFERSDLLEVEHEHAAWSSTPMVARAGYGETDSRVGSAAVPGRTTQAVRSDEADTNGAGRSAGSLR